MSTITFNTELVQKSQYSDEAFIIITAGFESGLNQDVYATIRHYSDKTMVNVGSYYECEDCFFSGSASNINEAIEIARAEIYKKVKK